MSSSRSSAVRVAATDDTRLELETSQIGLAAAGARRVGIDYWIFLYIFALMCNRALLRLVCDYLEGLSKTGLVLGLLHTQECLSVFRV